MPDPATKPEPDLLDHAPPGAMCLGCRYDISGMDIRAKCPECGDRIAPSVNFISLEHEKPEVLRGLDAGTRQAHRAGMVALAGVALVCAGYTLANKGLSAQPALFGTILGGGLLLTATLLAAQASRTITRHRVSGEEQRLRNLRRALSIAGLVSAGIAFISAVILVITATGHTNPGRRGLLSYFFLLWFAHHFVPIYLIFYFQMLADRSRALDARVFMGLGCAGFVALMGVPIALPGGHAIYELFGINVPNPFSSANLVPFDAYVWPFAIGVNIILALVAIAYFRRGMNFRATSEDQPPASPRS